MEDVIKKVKYHRTISVKDHDMEKANRELDRLCDAYIANRSVLHSNYVLTYGYQIWAASRSFCCERNEGEEY